MNKTDSAVRIRHNATGMVVTCRQGRSQHYNKQRCLKELRRRLEKCFHTPTPRRATAVPVHEKQKRLERKARQSMKKRMRKSPDKNGEHG